MTRQQKMEEFMALKHQTWSAIAELADQWLPDLERGAEWLIDVEFGAPYVRYGVRKKDKKDQHTTSRKRRYLNLSVPVDWLLRIHHQGLAIVDARLVLDAQGIKGGYLNADACWMVHALNHLGSNDWEVLRHCVVSLGGVKRMANGIDEAYQRCVQVFRQALGGEVEVPF